MSGHRNEQSEEARMLLTTLVDLLIAWEMFKRRVRRWCS